MNILRPAFITLVRKAAQPVIVCVIAVCAMTMLSLAQEGGMPAAEKQDGGIPAGGKWKEFQSEDKMTGAQKNRFELDADSLLPDSDARAKVILFCVGGKLALGDFRPNLKIGPPNWASFWGRPQMRVRVRVDSSSSHHHWNWVRGRFLAMDKDTVRQLIGAQIFKVEFETPNGRQIAEFSPAGLDLALVKKVCSLKPEKP